MNNHTTNHLKPKVLYSSAFSELVHHPENNMIIATWQEHSKKLVEQGVIGEITRLLDFIRTYKITHVVVDVRHYPFTNNSRIQHWINSFYVPNLMESTVVKYAFVVGTIPPGGSPDLDEELQPHVEYFTSYDEAISWMN